MICRQCGSDDLVYDSDGVPECMKCGFRDEDEAEEKAAASPLLDGDPDEGRTGCFDDLAEL